MNKIMPIDELRSLLGKSELVLRELKRLNKQRKKAGLKKLKYKNFKLVTPKG